MDGTYCYSVTALLKAAALQFGHVTFCNMTTVICSILYLVYYISTKK